MEYCDRPGITSPIFPRSVTLAVLYLVHLSVEYTVSNQALYHLFSSPCMGISDEIDGGTIAVDKAKIFEIKPPI